MNHLFILLQAQTQDTLSNAAQGEDPGELTLSFWELALKGGWIMLPIVILSIVAIYIFIERYFAITNAAKTDINFMNKIKDYIHDDKVESALTLCQTLDNPVARMIEKGIQRIGRPLNDINTAIENVGKLEISKLEKGLPTLATAAGAAPMIGFLGTVMGMIRAFYDMANAGSNIDITLLSSGIYTAMVTTVAGLMVGIISYLAYNVLVTKVEKVVYQLEANTTEFMDLLNEPVE
ncbi:MAG: MotA/TolQ/ExbB proton channel family protein [Bacteroidales bacterium]|jgi:biopolymer transport protein ExbB|nr:MotA/TolQ/ExbB proton channel family protein [Bacteroidales bacterium]